MKHANELTPAQDELLELLTEESAEVIHILSKIKRHGLRSSHPRSGEVNVYTLHKELGDVMAAVEMLRRANILNMHQVEGHMKHKLRSVGRYLHHAGQFADEVGAYKGEDNAS